MKIAVIGLGSMGKRRIRLIQRYDNAIEIIGVDSNADKRRECNEKYGIETVDNIVEVSFRNNFNCAFICTSPLSHGSLINECLNLNMHVFTEMNLVSDDYDKNLLLAKRKNLVLFISSTFLYRNEIKEIRSLVQKTKCMLNYTYHVGQYLADWHPWESYKDFFVENKKTNGCREILAIELPWLIDVFGDIIKIDVLKSKISSLDIEYSDNILLLIQHKNGYKGTLAVDVVSRKAVRNLEIFGEKLYISWDGSPTGLNLYDYTSKKDINIKLYNDIDQLAEYSSFVVENAYLNEITTFFEVIKNDAVPLYSFEKDREILKIIDQIEE